MRLFSELLFCPKELFFTLVHGLLHRVAVIHLIYFQSGSLLAVGSRDRYLHILDLTKLRSGDPESVRDTSSVVKMNAHKVNS